MKYQLEYAKRAGSRTWVVRGLVLTVDYENGKPLDTPDTWLHLVGYHEACDTPESIVRGVHRCLYDLLQTTHGMHQGDTFESAACVVRREFLPAVSVPAMRMHVEDVHVLLDEPKLPESVPIPPPYQETYE